MSTIENVIEMLTNIIGNDAPPGVDPEEAAGDGDKGKKRKKDSRRRRRDGGDNSDSESSNDDSEPEKLKTKVIESMKQRSKAKEESSAV